MTGAPAGGAGRDGPDDDALIVDRYLDSILAAHARGAASMPMPANAAPAAMVRVAIERLARDLPRFHPSFRFEEALATKLSDAASRMRVPMTAGGERVVVPFRDRGMPLPRDPLDGDGPLADPGGRQPLGRPLLIGGALTSAALSIAGAAYVAWRIRRAPRGSMARAIRAVARTRLA